MAEAYKCQTCGTVVERPQRCPDCGEQTMRPVNVPATELDGDEQAAEDATDAESEPGESASGEEWDTRTGAPEDSPQQPERTQSQRDSGGLLAWLRSLF